MFANLLCEKIMFTYLYTSQVKLNSNHDTLRIPAIIFTIPTRSLNYKHYMFGRKNVRKFPISMCRMSFNTSQ